MNGLRIAVVLMLVGNTVPAAAQIMLLDESLLWDQRLFETESAKEWDRPLQLRVYGGAKHDSNVFRLSDDADTQATIGSSDRADNVYQIGAGGRYSLEKSRQRFILEGAVEQYWFQNFDNLNNTSNLARGEWQWQAGNDWFGTLGVSHRTYLESFANVQQNIRDMVDRDRAYGSANYRPVSYLRFTVDADWTQSDHSAQERNVLDYRSDGAAFTAAWVTPLENSVGLKFRTDDTTYENASATGFPGSSYRDNEFSLVAIWHVTAASTFKGRLGHTERSFDQSPERDFSGPTWRFGYEWQPTGKTALEIAVWRELTGFEDLSGNYMRSTGVGIFPAWSVVPKVVLQAKAAYQVRDYLGNVGLAADREDKEYVLQLGAVWTPLRLTKVVLVAETGDRSSNQALADYDYQSLGLFIMRTF